jgi:hypothetical protein
MNALSGMASVAVILTITFPGAAVAASADDAVAIIASVTETTSEPFYNGSYYKISLSSPETCVLAKTLSDYSPDDELTKIVVTTYDVRKIDGSTIQPDGLGGIKFWSVGEEPVFASETTFGGDFSHMIPGDNLTVQDEASQVDTLSQALKDLVAYCSQH